MASRTVIDNSKSLPTVEHILFATFLHAIVQVCSQESCVHQYEDVRVVADQARKVGPKCSVLMEANGTLSLSKAVGAASSSFSQPAIALCLRPSYCLITTHSPLARKPRTGPEVQSRICA